MKIVSGRDETRPRTELDRQASNVVASDVAWSKRHRIAFQVYSGLLALFLLALGGIALLEVVIMWLPDDTLLSIDSGESYAGGLLVHRSHFMAMGLIAWTILPAIVVQVRKPWRRVAPMLVAAVMGIATLVAYGLNGTLQAWITEDLWFTGLILVLAALHPRARDLVRRPEFDRDMIRWAVIGAVPWAWYGLIQAELQVRPAPGDVHAGGLEHWAKALLMAVAICTCALVGASDHDGWRLPAWTAALASILFGVHSLVFPGLASGLSRAWAVAAVAWGGIYALLIIARTRRAATAVTPA